MELVAGLSLKNLKPRIWDPDSDYYLPEIRAVMVSYAEFNQMRARRRKAMDQGLHAHLHVPEGVSIYLDNGAFNFLRKGGEVPRDEYQAFVEAAKPDWYPIPQDYIPSPKMNDAEQLDCLQQTMAVNHSFGKDGFVPVLHISRHLDAYLQQFQSDNKLQQKQWVALGGIVPNLLRAPKAMAYSDVLDSVRRVREQLPDHQLHVFGIGGTATLHLAMLLGVDSVDSAGWRNRAARGIVQLPGSGDRMVANLGSWRGREPSDEEWEALAICECPACQEFGLTGLKEGRIRGFCNRATHNLWILSKEIEAVEARLANGTYEDWYKQHLDNTIYLPLIEKALAIRVEQQTAKGVS